jgi:hypothetical protein
VSVPGLVRVWDGRRAVVEAYPIRSGHVIGRDRFPDDEQMSAQHARIDFTMTGARVSDLQSRNGTYLDGARIAAGTSEPVNVLPATVCCGQSVFVLAADITPYAGARLERRGELDTGARTGAAWRAIEEAATAEDNVLVTGPVGSPKTQLAAAYIAKRGRGSVTYSPVASTRPLDRVLVPPIGTVVIEQAGSLTERDLETLEQWLETDIRFVTLGLPGVAARIPARLCARTIEIAPIRERPDEVACLVRRHSDAALQVHYSAIDECLRRAWRCDAEEIAAATAQATQAAQRRNGTKLRGGDFPPAIEPTRVDFRTYFERVIGKPPPFAIPDEYAPVITSDGREQMIASGLAEEVMLVAMQNGAIEAKPRGWFQYGFWGHGVNSYSFYFAEVTDRHRVFFRVPYGAGVYSSDPDAERARLVELLELYRSFRERPDVERALLIDAMGDAQLDVRFTDGRHVRNDGGYSIRGDLEALLRK